METPMMSDPRDWAERQWGACELGDRRRPRRAVIIGESLARCASSEAGVRDDLAAHRALYRRLDRNEVSVAALTEPHRLMACTAAAQVADGVLFVQDQTDLDFTAHPATRGLGPIASPNRKGVSLGRGFVAQTCLALEATGGRRLGLADRQLAVRPPESRRHRGETEFQRGGRHDEADVWLETLTHLGQPPAAATWISVGDRDSEVFRDIRQARDPGWHGLARLCHDRLVKDPHGIDTLPEPLLARLRGLSAMAGAAPDPLDGAPWRPRLTLSLAWTHGHRLAPPHGPWRKAEPVECWLLRAWDAAAGGEWLLLSTLPVPDAGEAMRTVQWYTGRWRVEEFHKALKTGGRYESARRREADRLSALLGFSALIAVRLLMLRDDARIAPDAPAVSVVSPLAVALVGRRRDLPEEGMTTRIFWQAVAGIGGFLGRKGDGEPGWLTLWRGWRQVSEWCWAAECATSLQKCG
jgi:hypothetical protein